MCGEEPVEIGLLSGRLLEDERDGGQGNGSVQWAEIILRRRHGVNMTCQAGAMRVLDRTLDEARLGGEDAGQDTSDEKRLWDESSVATGTGIGTPTKD